jgi:Restriction endonuclease
VTSGKFTQEARDFAGKQQISLIDGDELVAKITALLQVSRLQAHLLRGLLARCGSAQTPRRAGAHAAA